MCVFQLELWEQSLQALEAITLRCPNKVTPYVPNIVRLATQLSTFDPLYSYEDAHADADADMAKGKPNAKAAEEGWGNDAGDEGWGDEGDAEMNGPCTPRNTPLRLFVHPFAGARSACHHPTRTTLFCTCHNCCPSFLFHGGVFIDPTEISHAASPAHAFLVLYFFFRAPLSL